MGCKCSKTPVAQPEKPQLATGTLFEEAKIDDIKAQDQWQQVDGYISAGADILTTTMTVYEAFLKASSLLDCNGFCFRGEMTNEPVEVYFKSKWDNAIGTDKWTSFKKVEEERTTAPVDNDPHTEHISAVEDQNVTLEIPATTADDDLRTHSDTVRDGALPFGELVEASQSVDANAAFKAPAAEGDTIAPEQDHESAGEDAPVQPQSASWFSCIGTCCKDDQQRDNLFSESK